MPPAEPRSLGQRIADTRALLIQPAVDAWVATASQARGDGQSQPYLVPLSFAWIDERAVLALASSSRTAKNLVQHCIARIGMGPTRDIVLLDCVVEQVVKVADAPARMGDGYAAQADWDPREEGDGYVYVVLRPERIQAWRESNELPGRAIMRDGEWAKG
jgi:hypothetical protein